MITSPPRRQGSVNFLTQKLPLFKSSCSKTNISNNVASNGTSAELSTAAKAVVSPEPGLLIRCFACGLSDPQVLVQRGFLDLLVTKLPLDSPLLQDRVGREDLDRLVSAAIHVVLRREMSLNRRLWSWFLGPDPQANPNDSQPSSPNTERKLSANAQENWQFKYFSAYGRVPLERCIRTMFKCTTMNAADTARPFRICLSLMDRWEIGGSIVPQNFLPAIEMVYKYSLTALGSDFAEVMRSASLFFDGIEASLIWANLIKLLRDAFMPSNNPDNLQLFAWIIQRFNIKDEEMLTIHIPNATIYLLSLLDDSEHTSVPTSEINKSLDIVSTLLDLLPERAFDLSTQDSQVNSIHSSSVVPSKDLRNELDQFYQTRQQSINNERPIDGRKALELLYHFARSLTLKALDKYSEHAFTRAVAICLTLHSKLSNQRSHQQADFNKSFFQAIYLAASESRILAFPVINSTISLLVALSSEQKHRSTTPDLDIMSLGSALTSQIWEYLSLSSPKYHVEAVKSIWQLEDLVAPGECIQAALTALIRQTSSGHWPSENNCAEAARRFSVLWSHTVPAPRHSAKPGLLGHARRASSVTSVSDTKQALQRQEILTEPLMLLLDMLNNSNDAAFDVVKSWLNALPSLEQVFEIHFEFMSKSMASRETEVTPYGTVAERHRNEIQQELEYVLHHFLNILKHGSNRIWQCLDDVSSLIVQDEDAVSGVTALAECCVRFLCDDEYSSRRLEQMSIDVLDVLISGPSAPSMKVVELDSRLIDRLTNWLSAEKARLQGPLLRLVTKALKLRSVTAPSELSTDARPRGSLSLARPSVANTRQSPSESSTQLAPTPPPQLFNCLRAGFSTPTARPHLDEWLMFLSNILPIFADAIFANLIPLVECFCTELDKAYGDLVSVAKTGGIPASVAPEATTISLLEGLEMVLARAHECLVAEHSTEPVTKANSQPRSLLGNVTSGVFKAEGNPSRTAKANNRLTVILTFHDAIRVATKMWTWASHCTDVQDFDKTSAATTSYNALKVRNRTRNLLEKIFAVEPLESLEVVMYNWCYTEGSGQAVDALDLLHVMQGSRPKNTVPAVLDALCSRTNPSFLPPARQSSQTIDLTPQDVAWFLSAYLQSIEDDAMDEVWPDCMAFLRDVLANPLPHRQVLPALLSIILLLAEKVDNTNFGEQRKMRRDLGDLFLRLLTATFTTMPSGYTQEAEEIVSVPTSNDVSSSTLSRRDMSLLVVLKRVTANIEVVLETSDRTVSAINSISGSFIGPLLRAKSFPGSFTSDASALLLQVSKKAPTAKSWKKDLLEAFNDARLLASSTKQMEDDWFPVLCQWCLHDRERVLELLSRLSPPSSAGIMFGVGANAARLDADRRTQLNLRRACILLLSSPEDSFVTHLGTFEEKLVELFDASLSSSPSSTIKAELFMLCRALALSMSSLHLALLWPVINDNLQSALTSLLPTASNSHAFGNLSLLQACKLLDFLVAISPDGFQLHEWLYITDTIDAVYQPPDWNPSALSDQIAEALASEGIEDGTTLVPPTPISSASSGRRRPIIDSDSMSNKDDFKALTRDDFARTILRPFLSQLSIHAYEGVYSMDTPDLSVCRRNLLEDVLDLSTIVE